MSKLITVTAFAAGYVLGARAGKERYEQIKAQASKLWESAPVQEGRSKAAEQAKHAAGAAGSAVADKVKDVVSSSDGTSSADDGDDPGPLLGDIPADGV